MPAPRHPQRARQPTKRISPPPGLGQAAQQLNVRRIRVRALIQRGCLPAVQVGGRWIIREEDVALVEDRKPGYPAGQPRKRDPGNTP
jgi:excisionase family DNA binding protein